MAGVNEEKEYDAEEKASEVQGAETEANLESSGSLECPICLNPCLHPVELPCHHVFCFLCIKGVAMQGPNSKCAICRSPIPYSVLTNPHLKDVSQLLKEPKLADGNQWYYESRSGGWWQYDERTMQDLERAYLSNQTTCQLLVAGHIYTVDFKQMIQYRANNRTVSRRIKRGMNLEKRGVAGIRIAGNNAGAGSSGGATDGSPPPPPPQGSGASSSRRRRANSSATSSSVQTNTASGQSSSVSGNCSVVSGAAGPQNANVNNLLPHRDDFTDSDDEDFVDEDEDYNSDYSDVDEDMELGEEEEALIGDDSDERETEDEEDYDPRDGARAPTRRSDRSNSSNNQTPPPPSGSGITNGASGRTYSPNPNGRGSRGARSGRSSGGGRSGNGTNGSNSRSAPIGLSSPQSPASSNSNNVLASLFFNRCNLDDAGQMCNVSNNNIYVDLDAQRIIDQSLNYAVTVTQTFSSISSSANGVKITFDKRSSLNHDELL